MKERGKLLGERVKRGGKPKNRPENTVLSMESLFFLCCLAIVPNTETNFLRPHACSQENDIVGHAQSPDPEVQK